ncbi:filamentous hemagglutinin N-terminal domain-containing protein [Caballeronia sp. ATUFL_M1_KS5A]|uniref:two-partner secretion domain-containing protein n=1 Tax=Caballeronia sp. ATUFL_M1_KS5A TaxID=2921778 RepID=UPI0020281B38|nr:filamentous hemagglutinin N-terminal domain-containing protein [Caballeronia sp. ATUFL_M1_KS5A]
MLRCLDRHQFAIAHHPIALWHLQARRGFPTLRVRPLAFISLQLLLCISLALAAPPMLPKGGHFVAGSGSIADGGQSLTVNQTSSRGIVDWCNFSIGRGRTVIFDNGSGATLNRVTGSDASVILGRLSATGTVYLINPQGVVIGPSGVVATGGRFVASSLNVDNNAFMAGGSLSFFGGSNGVVVNLGKIGSSGADVILVSRTAVINAGEIDAAKGTAELAVGNQVLLQDSASSRQVFVQAGSKGNTFNAGAIRAAQVNLQAADGNVYALAGNSAAIRATGTATRDGHVWLVAKKGAVHANGVIEAADSSNTGGTVETLANELDVRGATVQAGDWKLGAPNLTIDSATANTLSRTLNKGTSVDAEANGTNGATGDLAVRGDVNWTGESSLTLGAVHNVTIASNATMSNTGAGSLTMRSDATGVNNASVVINQGTIDWSNSRGIVSILYDMNGNYSPGKIVSNPKWSAAPYSGLATQVTAYKLVNTLDDLSKVSQDLVGNYALGKDVDANATTYQNFFRPIGETADAPFTGQFDGFGHSIIGLSVWLPNRGPDQPLIEYIGLFGVIGATGIVRNINVTASIFGEWANAGLIAGRNDGTIAYVKTSGGSGGYSFGNGGNGGVAGINNGLIERSSSSADLGYGGGLVGWNMPTGTVVQSFASGTTRGGNHGIPGGLATANAGVIQQSYATGVVSAFGYGGGLVSSNGPTGFIEESFATGWVASPAGLLDQKLGGITAVNQGKISNTVYWDKETTTQTTATGSNTGSAPPNINGLTTAQMGTATSFAGWNFGAGGVWAMPAGATHPILQWQAVPN